MTTSESTRVTLPEWQQSAIALGQRLYGDGVTLAELSAKLDCFVLDRRQRRYAILGHCIAQYEATDAPAGAGTAE